MTASTKSSTTFDDGLQHIAGERTIWVRIAAIRLQDESWHAKLIELTSGAVPPVWKLQAWEYPEALLAGEAQTGEVVAEWLKAGKVIVGDREIHFSQGLPSLRWDRQQSRRPGAFEPLDWPVTETTIVEQDPSHGEPQGPLVSEVDAPSFLNFYTAAACFFWHSRRPTGGALRGGVVYRHQDTRGRINSVRIGRDGVEVEVEGSALGGMTVEFAGEGPGPKERIPDDLGASVQRVTFPLKGGLPEGAWVLLRSAGEWIDRRYLTVPWSQTVEAGVEVVVEPGTRLEVFIANREGPQVEFKRQIPEDEDSKAKVMKTVCAFANGEGGSVLFGVDEEEDLVGLPVQTVDRAKDQLTQMVSAWVEPRPAIAFETMPIDSTDKVVLELKIHAGPALYGCGRSADTRTPYIRNFATTVRARLHEIEEIVKSRSGSGRQTSEPGSLLGLAALLDDSRSY